MDAQEAIDLGREALWTMLLIGSPVLVAGMIVGLVIGLVIYQILFVVAVARIIFVQGGAL